MPEKPRVTLQDIADRDGTHVTTVSLALRNSPKLPAATRERIQSLAAEMGYTPDPALQSLVAYRRGAKRPLNRETLAYITNWTSRWGWREHPSHARFFEGATEAAAALGYRIEHFWLSEPGLSQDRLSQILAARGIRGVILASHSRQMPNTLRLDWDRLSGVRIDFFPREPALSSVSNNQCAAMRQAFVEARKSGARRIGLVMHRGWDMSVDRMWTAGYLVEQTLLAEDVRLPICYFPAEEPRSAWENETDAEVRIATDVFRIWYERWRPDAVIGCRGFIDTALFELGLATPNDLCLIDPFLYEPDGITAGLLQNHLRVGAAAVETLAGQLARNAFGIPASPAISLIEADWTDGASLNPRASATDPANG